MITKGTIATMGQTHIGSSTGIAIFLNEDLKDKRENIIKIIKRLAKELNQGTVFPRIESKIIKTKGPTIR